MLSDEAGDEVPGSRVRYYPYGQERTDNHLASLPTDFGFTGQRWEQGFGLYYYKARYYDPMLGRFVQADTIVPNPGNPQDLNRYAYVRNNPLRYTDPSGFFSEEEIMSIFGVSTWDEVLAFFETGGRLEGQWGYLRVLREAQGGDLLDIYAGEQGLILQGTFVSNMDSGYAFAPKGATGAMNLLTLGAIPGVTDYVLHSQSKGTMWYVASQVYPVLKTDWSRVDWYALVLDTIGCIGDALGLAALTGPQGEFIAAIGVTASEITDILSIEHAIEKTLAENEQGKEDLKNELIVMPLKIFEDKAVKRQVIAGIPVIGLAADMINVIDNLKQAWYRTP